MLVAVMSTAFAGSAWGEDKTITLDYNSFGLTTSYALKTATVDGFGFTVNQGYKGSGNVIQMNSTKGSGILYNTTAITGLKSVTVNVASGNKTYTITTGTSETPTANSQTGTTGGTYNATSGDKFFQLKVSGASYFSSIVITYDDSSSPSLTANDLTLNSTAEEFDLADGDGQTFQLTNLGSADGALTYATNNSAVATVSETGLITVVGDGTATITVTQAASPTYEGGTATCTVTVTDSRYSVSNLTFTAACGGSGTADDGASWTVTSDGTESVYDATSGIHYGTSSASVTYLQLSTSDINGSVKKVVINARDAQATATITVTVNGSSFTCTGSATATNTSTDYTFTGNSKGEIVVRVDRGSSMSKAIYVKSVKVYYEPSTDPAISADDVDIAWDTTSGSIDYTLENATGTVSAEVTTGDWLTLGTITEDEVPFTCAANTGAERTATVTLSFSGADNKVVTVTQAASPARYTTISGLFAGATTTATDVLVTFNNWVVSGVSTNGKSVFVTDNAGNGFVIYSSSDQSGTYSVGNILSGTDIPCSLKLNSGYAQLTGVSGLTVNTGGTVSTANIAMSSLAGVNTGALVSYNNLTCTVDGTTYTLTDGATTIQLYTALYNYTTTPDLENGHKYNITGIYQQYGETKEILPRSSSDIVEVFTPAVTATPASLTDFTYEVEDGPSATKTISVSGTNLTANITLSLGENSNFEMCLIENGTYTNSLTLTPSEGAVAATTVYVRMKSGLAVGDSYSGTITISSTDATDATVSLTGIVTAPVVDYATLPFNWTGGGKSDLIALTGVSGNGLGTDYAASNAPYLVKLDTDGDYIDIKTDDKPSRVYIGVKMLGGATTSTITVKASSNGSTFDDGEELTISGSSNSIVNLVSTRSFDASVRYIRLFFTKGSNVGVGPISIIAGSTVPATVNGSGYGTFASGFPLDFTNVSTVSAWQITGISGSTITFSQITGTVASGTGVLLKREASGDINIPVVDSGDDISGTNKLEGLTGYKTVAANAYYGLSGNQFVKVNAGTVPAGKALLPASALTANVKSFTFVFNGADGITETMQVDEETARQIFDLNGRQLQKPQRGINIVNGKKVLVK